MASASAGDGLSAGENRLEIGPAVPAPGVVVFAAAEKIGQNQLLMAHFGRGGWRDRIVNGTVQEKVGRKWMVQWDFPSSSGSTTTLGHGGTFFTRHATRHDPGHARAHDNFHLLVLRTRAVIALRTASAGPVVMKTRQLTHHRTCQRLRSPVGA